MNTVSFEFANAHSVFISHSDTQSSRIVITPNTSIDSLLEVQRRLPPGLDIVELSQAEFEQQLQRFYQDQSEQMGDVTINPATLLRQEDIELLTGGDDAPIIQLFNRLLSQAIRRQASDIHIEPFKNQLWIRFRIDGVLQQAQTLDGDIGPRLCSRIKVLANLDIAEQRLPQDGRMTVNLAGKPIDLRIATIPANHGERLVLRLLDKSLGQINIDQLGLPAPLLQDFKHLIRQNHGLILVCGPTGAGKTSTLYAALQDIHSSEKNILTVEDPIEYELAGIGQVPVNSAIDMGFAKALRAILRQDPDVLMVGEIRDAETASIAIQASLTGHLVLSTLHTNNAAEALTRLLDLDQEAYLLASAVKAIIAQRLLRKLCPDCKQPYAMQDDQAQKLGHGKLAGLQVFKAGQCPKCDDSGYSGRIAAFEMIVIDKRAQQQLQHLAAHSSAADQHSRDEFSSSMLAIETVQGQTLHSHCIDHLLAGLTSYEEILRVYNITRDIG